LVKVQSAFDQARYCNLSNCLRYVTYYRELSGNTFGNFWWARRDLNPQPRDYESPALTVELQALQ
jgi:hypothetical protein